MKKINFLNSKILTCRFARKKATCYRKSSLMLFELNT